MISNTMHKFPLLHGRELNLPRGFVARHVADQLGTTTLWAEVDPAAPIEHYLAEKVGTGRAVPPGGLYLGTILEAHGQYVWHFYAVPA